MKAGPCDILAFGAHPDDVEIGCGGTLYKLAQRGYKIGIIDLTEGELGTRGTVTERYQEAEEAARLLSVVFRKNLKIPDGGIAGTPEQRARVIEVLRKFCPKVVFAPYPDDRHPDHIHAGNLIREACFYAGVRKVNPGKNPPHRPAKLLYYMISRDFGPTFYVDISEQFATKLHAIRAYRSQFYNPEYEGEETFISSKNYLDSLETRARYFGWRVGVEFAEAFWMKEPLLLDEQQLMGN